MLYKAPEIGKGATNWRDAGVGDWVRTCQGNNGLVPNQVLLKGLAMTKRTLHLKRASA